MTKYTKVEVNCETGEETILELSPDEIAEIEQFAKEAQERRAAEEIAMTANMKAKASAQSKLAALGLTADEIAALSK